ITAKKLRRLLNRHGPITNSAISPQLRVPTTSSAMIGMARENCERAVNLFAQHRAHQKMRPGLRTEGKAASGAFARQRGEPVRSADNECEVFCSCVAQRAQHISEVLALHAFAFRVEKNDVRAGGHALGEP